jgi:predicted lipoprotein with Yx(FWY)xxD motif
MFGPKREKIVQSRRSRRRGGVARRVASVAPVLACSLAATALAATALAATALAASATLTIGSASSSSLGKRVAVNAQGRTLYALSPETAGHLLCKSGECLKFWPPLTVGSPTTRLKAGAGIHGHLGILHRSNGLLQVTLGGRPLYRFSRDHAKGQANGEGIESFGGTWHAITTGSASPTKSSTPATPTYPSMTPTPGY